MAEEPDAVDLLLAQHARIEELFRQVLAAAGEERRDRFQELARLLSVHETAEEEVVHPLARATIDAGDDVVDARLSEEHDAKELLADLIERGVEAPDFADRLRTLRAEVLQHAKREERYEFYRLRDKVDEATAKRLLKAVRAAEAFAPTRPHPGVEGASANLAAGPVLAMTDRVRDAVRDALDDRKG